MKRALLAALLLAGCGGDGGGSRSRNAGESGHMDRAVWTGDVSEDAFLALHQLSSADVPPLQGHSIDLTEDSRAYLSLPEGDGPHPAVLVIHEWWGLNDHIRHWADRLAADGYAALAVDLYDGRIATRPGEAIELMREVEQEPSLAILRAAAEYLRTDPQIMAPRTAVMGWCFGGGWSFETALHVDGFDAVVVYYGRPVTDAARLRELDGPLLAVYANQDTAIPPAMVDQLETALEESGIDYQLLRFDAVHAFANPSNEHYDHDAAERAWEAVQALLARTLRPGGGT